MNTTVVLAGLSASTILSGVICAISGWAGHVADPVTGVRPPSRWRTVQAALVARRHLLLVAVLSGVVILGLTGWPVAGVASVGAVLAIPRVVSAQASVDRIRKLEALEQWTRRLADMLTAGRGLEQALEHSAARNVPVPIAAAVSALARRLSVSRMPTEQALRLFADELDDPVGDRIAAALILVARRRGRGASTVLGRLAELVAKDVADRREVEAARAEHRTTVRWIVGIFLLFTAAAVFQRSYVAPFSTLMGQVVLVVVVAFYGAGLWWLHRLGSTAPSHRFLIDQGGGR